jgi:hypothetical protein
VAPVTRDVRVELGYPKLGARFGHCAVRAAFMTVPEATMHVHGKTVSSEYQVGCSRQIPAMQTEAEAQPMRGTAHDQLRRCIAWLDAGHHFAPRFSIDYVCHAALVAAW